MSHIDTVGRRGRRVAVEVLSARDLAVQRLEDERKERRRIPDLTKENTVFGDTPELTRFVDPDE